jgi:ribosomal protein L15
MIENKKFGKSGNAYEIDLTGLGYTKLLSKGVLNYPVDVKIASATEKAVKKVNAAGGNINSEK